jgi:hypothetical protein
VHPVSTPSALLGLRLQIAPGPIEATEQPASFGVSFSLLYFKKMQSHELLRPSVSGKGPSQKTGGVVSEEDDDEDEQATQSHNAAKTTATRDMPRFRFSNEGIFMGSNNNRFEDS